MQHPSYQTTSCPPGLQLKAILNIRSFKSQQQQLYHKSYSIEVIWDQTGRWFVPLVLKVMNNFDTQSGISILTSLDFYISDNLFMLFDGTTKKYVRPENVGVENRKTEMIIGPIQVKRKNLNPSK
jgi:hypothetical protein